MSHYYNENDPGAAAWLRQLIADGLIPAGDVDTRSIVEVQPDEVRAYTQCHFFAGIGGWALALQLAGWPVDRPIWTGSCPCQPFSDAGQQKGAEDARHLWPEFQYLIAECDPPDILGEQVASKLGRRWLAGVRADLEALGYAVGAADLCAACAGEEGEGWIVRGDQGSWERIRVGSPHIRQRLYWVANARRIGGRQGSGSRRGVEEGERSESGIDAESHGAPGRMADAGCASGRADDRNAARKRQDRPTSDGAGAGARGKVGGLADAELQRTGTGQQGIQRQQGIGRGGSSDGRKAGRMGVAVGERLERHAGHGDDGNQPGRIDTQSGRSTAEAGGTGNGESSCSATNNIGGLQNQWERSSTHRPNRGEQSPTCSERESSCRMGNSASGRNGAAPVARSDRQSEAEGRIGGAGGSGTSFWSAFDLIPCRDGKSRRVEPGTFPLAHGVPGRVGLLRGYGNAIVPELAATFIEAVMAIQAAPATESEVAA